jgi:hypothetical protein
MTRFLIVLVSLICAACTVAEQTAASSAAAPRKARSDGNTHAVSDADIRTVLALMPAHDMEWYHKSFPVGRIHVIGRDTMSVHYWRDDDTWTYARRVKGQWRIDFGVVERVIVSGSYIHAGP